MGDCGALHVCCGPCRGHALEVGVVSDDECIGGVLGVGGILLACLSFVVCSPLMRSKEGSAHHQVPTVPVAPPPEMIISGTRRKFNSDEKPPPEVDGPVPRAAPSERV